MIQAKQKKLANRRPVTPPPALKTYSFEFQATGRPVGIVWDKRTRFDQLEARVHVRVVSQRAARGRSQGGAPQIFIAGTEDGSQAARKGIPTDLQLVLRGVRSEAGEMLRREMLTGLRYRDIMNIMDDAMKNAPMELVVCHTLSRLTSVMIPRG